MRLNLLYPSNWIDFQDLCFQLWKEMWRDPDAHPNGRNGQAQNGVDIWGKNMFDNDYSGVQCKGKNGNYKSLLTTDEIDSECKKAINFKPKLTSFIMATTSPRDVKVQQHCRNLTRKGVYPFSVDTWSWDDIEDEVQCRPTIMEHFYPDVKGATLLPEIQIPVFASVNKLHAFFSRPGLFNKLNSLALDVLKDLAYEIAINAFEHGKAGTFGIKVENDRVIFTDNGRKFDCTELLKGKGNGGKATIEYATGFFDITYKYDTKNILELSLPNNLDLDITSTNYTINFNAKDIFGRGAAERFVLNELMKVPTGCEKIIVDICGQANPAISCSFAVIDKLLQLKSTEQTVVVYLPENLYYKENIIDKYSNLPNVDIKIKK